MGSLRSGGGPNLRGPMLMVLTPIMVVSWFMILGGLKVTVVSRWTHVLDLPHVVPENRLHSLLEIPFERLDDLAKLTPTTDGATVPTALTAPTIRFFRSSARAPERLVYFLLL